MLLMIPLKPISNNHMQKIFRNRIVKSADYRQFEKDVSAYMSGFNFEIDHFLKQWNTIKSCIIADYTIYTPKYFKADKTMSLTGGDVANFEKCLTDAIFNKLGINDAYIQEITIRKIPSDNWLIACNYQIGHHPILGEIHQF